jgi:hypothetical protein
MRHESERDPIARLKDRLDFRLNEYLCEMQPGYDDSITGFNEAWDVMRKLFAELPMRPASPTADAKESARRLLAEMRDHLLFNATLPDFFARKIEDAILAAGYTRLPEATPLPPPSHDPLTCPCCESARAASERATRAERERHPPGHAAGEQGEKP